MRYNEKAIQLAIDQAKESVIKSYGHKDYSRPWVVARARHEGWEDGSQDMELHMWEGSPAKGWVVVNYGSGTATAFGVNGRKIHTYGVMRF